MGYQIAPVKMNWQRSERGLWCSQYYTQPVYHARVYGVLLWIVLGSPLHLAVQSKRLMQPSLVEGLGNTRAYCS